MKYVYTIAGIFMVLFGTHIYAYSEGYKAGRNKVAAELHETTQAQAVEIMQANKKILDLQRIIGNNNDECFNRVWPDEIINAANPSLLR